MIRTSDILKGSAAAAGMALLILDAKTALTGAQNGIELCIRTVIPSLFPFFLLSILLTGTLMGAGRRLLDPLCHIFRIPTGAGTLLLSGILGGYPVGAQCVGQAFERGSLSHRDARRMLAFCSNCGPAFLFGMIGAVFDEWWIPWALWAVHLISAWITSCVVPSDGIGTVFLRTNDAMTVQQALNKALKVMASVCGWVVLFRLVIQFWQRWFLWLLPEELEIAICGILELSNGCVELSRIENTGLRFILCAGFLGFGGLCVTMQTYSVITPELDRRMYFPGKLLQCCISLIAAGCLQWILHSRYPCLNMLWVPLLIGVLCAVILRKIQNNSSIPAAVGV